jgi:hypothetical protein
MNDIRKQSALPGRSEARMYTWMAGRVMTEPAAGERERSFLRKRSVNSATRKKKNAKPLRIKPTLIKPLTKAGIKAASSLVFSSGLPSAGTWGLS